MDESDTLPPGEERARDPLLLAGEIIDGKYAIESLVGTGGTSVVYRATHLVWKRPVAIKLFRSLSEIPPHGRAGVLEEFAREGQLLTVLSEQTTAIVQARDIGTMVTKAGEWTPYLVLEWLEGATLEAVLEREQAEGVRKRSLAEAIALLDPAARALALAHRRGIAHRDVKPSNLFVVGPPRSDDVSIKLLDFGIAKVVAEFKQGEQGFRQTSASATSFTPAYGAPEQFSKDLGPTGPWTDVFGLALVLMEVVSGLAPLAGDSLAELQVASTRISLRPSLGPGVASTPAKAVLARAVAVNPRERYASAGEFWSALRAAVDLDQSHPWIAPESTPHPPPPSAVMTLRPPRQGRRWAVGAFALAAALTTAAAVTVHARRPPEARRGASPATTVARVASAAIVAPVATCPDGMVAIPGGKFFMGSDSKDAVDNEKPAHKVALAPFCIDRFEVTTRAYRACSDAGECKRAGLVNDWRGITDQDHESFDSQCNALHPEERAEHPINCIDWQQAVDFCSMSGRRLPTEAEWEFAARGPDGRKYPWGDEAPTAGLLNACGSECVAWGKAHKVEVQAMFEVDDGWATTAPVGSFPRGASRYGVEDVVGNVWEWVADWYAPYAEDQQEQQTDPRGPERGEARVIRGGAWNGGYPSWVRPTFRYRDAPKTRSYGIGLRCAKSR